MNCPVCGADLERASLLDASAEDPTLRGFRCPGGHGVFLPSDLYFAWRERHAPAEQAPSSVPPSGAVGDLKQAKLCPQNARIMRRAQTGPDGFWLDRCATCGGVWFDGQEWEATVEAGLLDLLPTLFTDAWQRQIDEAQTAEHWQSTLEEQIGADDLARVDAFREWAWAHPLRHLVMARLTERPEAADA